MHVQEQFNVKFINPKAKATGNEIFIYLALVVEDIKKLWINRVVVCDAFSESTFNLRTILMWTNNEFSAYANLSGWSTNGKLACPVYCQSTFSKWLSYSRKFAYMGYK